MTEFNPLEYFRSVYDAVPEWAEMFHRFSPEGFKHYTLLRNEALRDGALSRKEKELILVAINAARRYERSMLFHTKGAVDAGASVEEVAEIAAVCVLSRGIPAWFTGVEAIKYAVRYMAKKGIVRDPVEADGDSAVNPARTLNEALDYFRREASGSVPEWAAAMASLQPEALVGYAALRQRLLRDGAVSRKLKELALMGINLAERYPKGVRLHADGARKHGASDEEIAETALTALLTGGIPAWFEVVDSLKPDA